MFRFSRPEQTLDLWLKYTDPRYTCAEEDAETLRR